MHDDLYNTLEHFFLEDVREKFEISEVKKIKSCVFYSMKET